MAFRRAFILSPLICKPASGSRSSRPLRRRADRLRLANGRRIDEATVARLAPQVAEVAAGLAALEARLAREAEPATVERVDERDW